MAFPQESSDIPSDIGRIRILLTDNDKEHAAQTVTIAELDTGYPLENKNIRAGSVTVESLGGQVTYLENTDYTIDYANGEITILSTGAGPAATPYHIDYQYHDQGGAYVITILDQNGEAMLERSGDLAPHLTSQEKTTIANFLDTLRARALAEAIP